MKRILSLVGARPQFIKEAVVHKVFEREGVNEILVHSGQHYDANMSDVFFEVLGIRQPDYFLNVGSGNHGEMTGKIMIEFEKVVLKEKPDVILVYGDTNTTLAGALVGAKLKIPVAHIEAGIRQEPKDMPEEINRVVTDHVSSYLFCPTKQAVLNLEKEGITKGVYFVGDVMYDLFLMMEPKFSYEVFETLNLFEDDFVLVTLHRDFNVDVPEKLERILNELRAINRVKKVVFPMHPRTRKRVFEFGLVGLLDGLTVIEPVDYLNLMGLLKRCWKVVTDSGGLQKEAYFAGKRAVVVMPDTGWRELVDVGWNVLAREDEIAEKIFQDDETTYPTGLYGNGDAANKIVDILLG
ncbi:non-hydrolyzing UDP-N-acetylglucosamine 2-epimerase [Fervidobacterium thailandense]|uniref:non-hydrolyzing UDP-N-acetylglucosamine 2-epimerase n=1 Tax=Fervidobacterium thailandense TaxID=1008305 RepID=UPI000B014952|nr:UDP-N-acetylglucosamine 2-epimerase (non-hydrolyzing) [Fervidobacterium thailandense]